MTIYAIIDKPAWNNGIWAEVVQDYATARRSLDGTKVVVKWTAATARRSVDGTKVVVKWTADEETPAHLPDGAPLYYHPDDPPDDLSGYTGDILTVMDSPEWTATPG